MLFDEQSFAVFNCEFAGVGKGRSDGQIICLGDADVRMPGGRIAGLACIHGKE